MTEGKREIPKYQYDKHIITTPLMSSFSRYGIDFVATVEETQSIETLDSQRELGKSIFGKGFIISDQLLEKRLKAEEEEEKRKIEAGKGVQVWELSDRERAIIAQLSQK